jgi:hypothetical protein
MFFGKMESPPWIKDGEMPPKAVAMEYCKEEIEWYERQVRLHWWPWLVINIVLLSASAVATMLAANPAAIDSNVIRAIPAAVVFIMTGMLGLMNLQAEVVRKGMAHDALRGEPAKFRCKASPYTGVEEDDIKIFVLNMRLIISGELEGWRQSQTPSNTAASRSSPAPHNVI